MGRYFVFIWAFVIVLSAEAQEQPKLVVEVGSQFLLAGQLNSNLNFLGTMSVGIEMPSTTRSVLTYQLNMARDIGAASVDFLAVGGQLVHTWRGQRRWGFSVGLGGGYIREIHHAPLVESEPLDFSRWALHGSAEVNFQLTNRYLICPSIEQWHTQGTSAGLKLKITLGR